MKKYLIASHICLVGIVLFGCVNPLIMFIPPPRKEGILLLYVIILAVCVSTVATTVFLMGKYTSYIDRIDEKEIELDKEKMKLTRLIEKYNELIQKN